MITHLLAIDGGGSKTALRLVSVQAPQTETLLTQTLAPSSLTQYGEKGVATLRSAISKSLAKFSLKPQQVSIAIGVAGAGNMALKQILANALSTYPHCQITTDSYTSLVGANQAMPVNIIAIGTGAVASTLNQQGEIQIVGGWGFPIGDEGGGAWLGQQAIRVLITAIESQNHTPITQKLISSIGNDRKTILHWLSTANATDFARLTPEIMACANASCPDSLAILGKGKKHIEKLIQKCCKNNTLPIIFLGGLSSYYQDTLEPQWRSRVTQAKGNALDGAMLLALKKVGENDE